MSYVSEQFAQQLIGQNIQAMQKDGSIVVGRLVRVMGGVAYLQPIDADQGKTVKTKAVIPLVLFNLLAISTLPFVYGGYPRPVYPAPYNPGYGPDFDGHDHGCCGGRGGYPGVY